MICFTMDDFKSQVREWFTRKFLSHLTHKNTGNSATSDTDGFLQSALTMTRKIQISTPMLSTSLLSLHASRSAAS